MSPITWISPRETIVEAGSVLLSMASHSPVGVLGVDCVGRQQDASRGMSWWKLPRRSERLCVKGQSEHRASPSSCCSVSAYTKFYRVSLVILTPAGLEEGVTRQRNSCPIKGIHARYNVRARVDRIMFTTARLDREVLYGVKSKGYRRASSSAKSMSTKEILRDLEMSASVTCSASMTIEWSHAQRPSRW